MDGHALDELEALRLLVRSSTDMLSRHAPDGTYRYVSPACRNLLGYDPEDLVGRSAWELFHPDDVARIAASHDEVLDAPDISTVTYRIRHRSGEWRWFETTSHTIRDPATREVLEIHTSSRDVTSRVQAEARLRESEQQWRLAMENAPIGMALVATDGTFLAVNHRLGAIVGRDPDELLTLTFQDITHADDLDADLAYVGQLLEGSIHRYTMEKRYLHADGHVVWVLLSVGLVRDLDGEPVHFVAQIQDITERLEKEEQLRLAHEEMERLAYEDDLTGLPSRRAVFASLDLELRHDDRHGRGVAVLLADVDHFKQINDRHGHLEGDRVLREIGAAVRRSVRTNDSPGRFGGEELLVVMPETDADAAVVLADRIREEVAASVATADGPVRLSVGVATRRPAETADQLVRRADTALYRAKEAGRDRTTVARAPAG